MKITGKKCRIGDFDVALAGDAGEFVRARRQIPPAHQYWFRVSHDRKRAEVDPSILYGDVSTGKPEGHEWRFVDEAREAADGFLRQERRDKGAPTAS